MSEFAVVLLVAGSLVWAVIVAVFAVQGIRFFTLGIEAARRYLGTEEPPAAVTDAAGRDLHTERNVPRSAA